MKYLAAYLLLVAGGNAAPTAADIKTLLATSGVEVEEDRVAALIKALEGKTVQELLEEGQSKLAAVPTGGAVAAGAGAAAGGAAAAEEAAEEAKEEEKEESDDDMGFGLFD